MKRSRAPYVSLLVLVVAGIGMAAVYILARGISARSEPSSVEAFIARRLRHFAIPRNGRAIVNPVQPNSDVLAGAMEHFADHCAICHGNDGRGTPLIGRGLYP